MKTIVLYIRTYTYNYINTRNVPTYAMVCTFLIGSNEKNVYINIYIMNKKVDKC